MEQLTRELRSLDGEVQVVVGRGDVLVSSVSQTGGFLHEDVGLDGGYGNDGPPCRKGVEAEVLCIEH